MHADIIAALDQLIAYWDLMIDADKVALDAASTCHSVFLSGRRAGRVDFRNELNALLNDIKDGELPTFTKERTE